MQKPHNLNKGQEWRKHGENQAWEQVRIIPGKLKRPGAPSTGLFCTAAKSIDHPLEGKAV